MLLNLALVFFLSQVVIIQTSDADWKFMKVLSDKLDELGTCNVKKEGVIVIKRQCALAYLKKKNSKFLSKYDITFNVVQNANNGLNDANYKDGHAWIGAKPSSKKKNMPKSRF